ncbi:MAG: EAL domain-containing protein [Candidatus Nanopelagicales bacterium]
MAQDLWVVGIGASAGGVEALRELVPHLPQAGAAFVVAQHMSPVHPSLLMQVLARETSLDVVEVVDGQPLRAGALHVVPPNRDVTVSGENLLIRQAAPRISPQPSIDALLTSLASSWGPKAVAIVLSGTGTDGALGVAAVKEAGGYVLVQDPDSAAYRDMPVAALDSGVVDLLLPPERIGSALSSLLAGDPVQGASRWSDDALMASLARETRKATGWDLAAYKDGTVTRQLTKRMHALGLQTREEYVAHALADQAELVELRDSMLITVTGFLRDRASFDALREQVRALVAAKAPGDDVRAWVAGCATGEEAYSVAMLLLDAIEARGNDLTLKVFATDISDRAMDVARRGRYPASSAEDIPEDWRQRWLDQDGDAVVVRKGLRELVVFARQDLTRDPPLVRMDLVTCRNLLIYLVPTVQARVMNNIGASLAIDGLLFLGRSEAGPAETSGFIPVSASHRIYRRGERIRVPSFRTLVPTSVPPAPVPESRRAPRDDLRDLVRDRLLAVYGPPSVLVDSSYTPVHQVGDVARFLGLPPQGGDFVLGDMVLPSLRTEVLTLLGRVVHGEAGVRSASLLARHPDGTSERVTVQVTRASALRGDEPHFLVSFLPVSGEEPASDGGAGAEPRPVGELENELAGTREHLHAVVEELEASNEELQAMNEELQASSEELQATNEELETTNEELQATNEELTTVNETLEVRSTELTETNAVLQSIQDSVHTAIVIVDTEMRVLSFSPLAVKVFGLTRADLGTDLSRLPSHLDVSHLRELVERMLLDDDPVVEEVRTGTTTYLLQVAAYRPHDRVGGAILALSDITELDEARRDLAGRAEEVQVLAEALPHMLFRADVAMTRFTYVSPSSRLLLGIEPEALLADMGLLTGQLLPADAAVLDEQRARMFGADTAMDYRLVRPDGTHQVLREVSRVVPSGMGTARIGTLIDITDLSEALDEAERHRRRSEGIYRLGGGAMLLVSVHGRIHDANDVACTLLGRTHDELEGTAVADLATVDAARLAELARTAQREGSAHDQVRLMSGDGRELQVVVHLARVDLDGPDPDDAFLVASLHDLTDLELSRRSSEARRAQFEAVFNHTGAAMAVLSTDGRISRCNRAFGELLGREDDEVVGRRTTDLTHPEDVGNDLQLFAELVRAERSSYQVEKRFVRSDGQPVWARVIVSAARTTGGPTPDDLVIMTLLDVSEERRREADALRLSRSDPLTGLANRLLVFDRLEQELHRAHRTGGLVSVLFIDLDGFKGINDRLGHEAGDTVLRIVADRIRGSVRDSDSVARLGGDEFLVVAPHDQGQSAHEGMRLAERIISACAQPVQVGENGSTTWLRLCASVGVAQYPADGEDADELVRRADTAMYSAKQRGGDQVRFYSSRLQDSERMRSAARAELSSAVESGLVVPWYQPIYAADGLRPHGVEVLARWQHPDRGVLDPVDFLAQAEEFHLLDALTEHLVAQVVDDLPKLRTVVPGLTVSLNLAVPQLVRPQVLAALLEAAGPTLEGWVVEVTEDAAFTEPAAVHDAVAQLQAAGASVSLDDFGTGYSSVLHLRDYGFDELKIDRAFVSRATDPEGRALLEAMLAMAHALGARTVAEGVETGEQHSVLVELGVDLLQGYLLGRPQDAATTAAWLSRSFA